MSGTQPDAVGIGIQTWAEQEETYWCKVRNKRVDSKDARGATHDNTRNLQKGLFTPFVVGLDCEHRKDFVCVGFQIGDRSSSHASIRHG